MSQRHKRAVGIGVVVSSLVLLGVALVLGSAALSGRPQTEQADATPTWEPTATIRATPSAEASAPEPSASATPELTTPSPAPEPGWQPIGTATTMTILVSFEGGYVGALDGRSAALFSADGTAWEATTLFERGGSCPETFEGSVTLDAWVTHGASRGSQVLLAGGTLMGTAESCATSNLVPGGEVAWLTSDGHTWVQSELFGAPGTALEALWSMADGWYATVTGFQQPPTTWQSPDGIRWHEVGSPAGVGAPSEPGPTGARLWWTRNESDEVTLLRSDDDATWHSLTTPPPALTDPYFSVAILPPGPGVSEWLVVTQAYEDLTSWTSTDLEHWAPRDIPEIPRLTDVVTAIDGHLVSGSLCPLLLFDAPCVESERQYVRTGGGDWVPIDRPLLEHLAIADGPAGIIAVQWDGSVWRLEP